MLDLVGNPEDRFSHNENHFISAFQFNEIICENKVSPRFLDFSCVFVAIILLLSKFHTDFCYPFVSKFSLEE